MTPAPSAPRCSNRSRGFKGTLADIDDPLKETFTPGPPAFIEGQRAGALQMERKRAQKQGRDAANSAKGEGRLGYQQAPNSGRVVRFAGDAPARDGGHNLRWDAGGPSGKGGKGASLSAGGDGRFGQGRGGFQHSFN